MCIGKHATTEQLDAVRSASSINVPDCPKGDLRFANLISTAFVSYKIKDRPPAGSRVTGRSKVQVGDNANPPPQASIMGAARGMWGHAMYLVLDAAPFARAWQRTLLRIRTVSPISVTGYSGGDVGPTARWEGAKTLLKQDPARYTLPIRSLHAESPPRRVW